MTTRERLLAVIQGREHDKTPFVQYNNNGGPDTEVMETLGADNFGILTWIYPALPVMPNCRFETESFHRDGRDGFRRTLHTPEGMLTEERIIEPAYGSSAAHEHYIKDPEDYRILLSYLRDAERIFINREQLLDVIKQNGDHGLPHTSVSRTPYQMLWVEWVDMEDLAIHIMMYPEIMEEVFTAIRSLHHLQYKAIVEVAREFPVPYIVFPDNITAPMIGPDYFEQFCTPAYAELDGMLKDAGIDIPIYVHMDGDLAALHDAIGQTVVQGLDSMSPPPDNDTSVAQARTLWPYMRICPNFPSSVHLESEERIYQVAMEMLEQNGRNGKFQIQISENVPKDVWRKSYPAIARAINDFGPPCR